MVDYLRSKNAARIPTIAGAFIRLSNVGLLERLAMARDSSREPASDSEFRLFLKMFPFSALASHKPTSARDDYHATRTVFAAGKSMACRIGLRQAAAPSLKPQRAIECAQLCARVNCKIPVL
jgi:hypothetical protein